MLNSIMNAMQTNSPIGNLLMMVMSLALVGCVAWVLHVIYKQVARRIAKHHIGVVAIILNAKLLPRLLHFIPQIILAFLAKTLFTEGVSGLLLEEITWIYFVWNCCSVLSAVLGLAYQLSNYRNKVKTTPLKGLLQAIKILIYCTGAICLLAILTGRSPVYILSGLTALSAVLMLIFKDSILGFTAGITLASNKLVQIGDWVEMPSANADGNIVDISLTTIRVQNWDNTTTSIPAYDMISKSFKNWRSMDKLGGRRIKRAIYIDLESIAFADAEMFARWEKIDLLREHLSQKEKDISAYNAKLPGEKALDNQRRLTNIGVFRAYCLAYLKRSPEINQAMTVLVRQLQPTQTGLPLEIYCFTRQTDWNKHEAVQSDMFDHFLSILPTFGLKCFEVTSTNAIRNGIADGLKALETKQN